MNKNLRKAVIAGNWKMNNTPAETTALLNEMKPLVADADCDVVICAPFVDLQAALDATAGSNIMVVQKTATGLKAVPSQLRFQLLCLRQWVFLM